MPISGVLFVKSDIGEYMRDMYPGRRMGKIKAEINRIGHEWILCVVLFI